MSKQLDLSGRAVLVTGGTHGIGHGISECFLAAGAQVLVCARSEIDADELPSADGRRALFLRADVRDPDQATACTAATVAHFGRLDVVVNNAGGSPAADSADASPRFSEAIIRLNLLAPLFIAQAANMIMQEQEDGGRIINIASVSAVRPSPNRAAYGAAKAGLVNLSKTLAVEWAPKVRVNAIIAGLIHTETAALNYGDEDGIRATAASIPAGRMGTPEDIGNACLYLASPLASFVSGSALEVHGGGESPRHRDPNNTR